MPGGHYTESLGNHRYELEKPTTLFLKVLQSLHFMFSTSVISNTLK